ncbi:hypothetical protein [uncultured Campylobacter sp.]|uniref:hypothetical protein n=1 Tax=uncultured Campylobacter sp. TaxID=218934 RepID=UPI00262C8B4E|nr:hypothetical protein [uncultured Campylobacter sp.]
MLLGKTVAMSSFKILILAWVKFNDSAFCRQGIMYGYLAVYRRSGVWQVLHINEAN